MLCSANCWAARLWPVGRSYFLRPGLRVSLDLKSSVLIVSRLPALQQARAGSRRFAFPIARGRAASTTSSFFLAARRSPVASSFLADDVSSSFLAALLFIISAAVYGRRDIACSRAETKRVPNQAGAAPEVDRVASRRCGWSLDTPSARSIRATHLRQMIAKAMVTATLSCFCLPAPACNQASKLKNACMRPHLLSRC